MDFLKSISTYFRSQRDIARIGLMAAIVAGLLIWDQSNRILLDAAGAAMLFALFSHINRRILFHKTDVQAMMKKASEHPLGAGMVVVSICAVLISMMWISVYVLK